MDRKNSYHYKSKYSKRELKNRKVINMHPLQRRLIQQYETFVQLVERQSWDEMLDRLKEVELLVEKMHPYQFVKNGYPQSYQLFEYSFELVKESIQNKKIYDLRNHLKKLLVPTIQTLLHSHIKLIENEIAVGVYNGNKDALITYPKERIYHLEKEAEKQNVILYYFQNKDIDVTRKQIDARYYKGSELMRKVIDYPKAIYNTYGSSYFGQSKTEMLMRKEIPFCIHRFGDKLEVPQRLLSNAELGSLFIPFIGVLEVDRVLKFLEKYHHGVLKPYRAARGEDVFSVKRLGDDLYEINHHGEIIEVSRIVFEAWIEESLIDRGYILQRYVHCVTKDGKPYDMRVLMQKNGCGQWVMRMIYPRIGKGDSIVSTTNEGESKDIFTLLHEEFGNQAMDIYLYIQELGIKIASAIDEQYGNAVEEQGLDIAIDTEGNIWMYESNNKPGTFGIAIKNRAMNAIAYAKYLAHHQIFPTNEYQNRTDFDSTTITEAPLSLDHDCLHVGVLIADELQETTDEVARLLEKNDAIASVFTLRTIDVQKRMIYAKNYMNGEWVEGLVPFPQVIIDRVQMREIAGPEMYYSHFENIPMTYTVPAKDFTSLTVDAFLRKDDHVKDYLIDYDTATIDLIQTYIQQYSHIVLRSIKGTSPFIEVKKKSKQLYEMTEGTDGTVEVSLPKVLQFIQSRLEFDAYIVQPYIQHIERNGQEVNFHVQLLKYDSNQPFQLADVYVTYDGVRQENAEWDYPVSEEKIEQVARKLVDSYIEQAKVQFGYVTVSLTYDERTKQVKYLLLDPFTRTHFEDEQSLLEAQVQYACSLLA